MKYDTIEVFEKETITNVANEVTGEITEVSSFAKCDKKEATHKILCRCKHNLPCRRVKL